LTPFNAHQHPRSFFLYLTWCTVDGERDGEGYFRKSEGRGRLQQGAHKAFIVTSMILTVLELQTMEDVKVKTKSGALSE
jgi:hypothetical protein